METSTQFDLNDALRQWRDDLQASPALQGVDLEELEAHLRDSMESLRSSGLSEVEAFMVARRRLGGTEALQHEHGKINQGHVWLTRALWMVAGVLVAHGITSLASATASLAVLGVSQFSSNGHLWGISSTVSYWGMFLGLATALCWTLTQRLEAAGRWTEWLRAHFWVGAVSLITLLSVSSALSGFSNVLMIYRTHPGVPGAPSCLVRTAVAGAGRRALLAMNKATTLTPAQAHSARLVQKINPPANHSPRGSKPLPPKTISATA